MGRIVGLTFGVKPQGVKPSKDCACPICGKTYKTQEGLTRHTEKEHPDDGEDKHLDE